MPSDPVLRSHIVEGCEIGLSKLRTILDSIDTSKIRVDDPKQIMNLANAFSGLTRAYTDLMRESRDTRSLLIEVHEQVKQLFRAQMATRPDLLHEVLTMLDTVCAEVEATDDGRNRKLLAANKARHS